MADTQPDLAACVARIRAGDARAAEELVHHLAPLVRRIVGNRVPWQQSPEDLVQEVFFKIFTRLDQYAGIMPFEHWATKVAVNVCHDSQRRQQRNRELRCTDLSETDSQVLENLAAEQAGTELDDGVAARELAGKLLASLSPEDRLVLTLLDLESRSAAEVQAVTGWSITSIRVRAFRARRKLRREMERLAVTKHR